tara:strand:+ start:55 stop:345 length:291 start_codon:yes stop_codon:yes gene_type:complete
MAEIKLVSGKTIIKKITVGVPIRAVKAFNVETTIGQLNDVVSAGGKFRNGYVLVFDSDRQQWVAQLNLTRQLIDGGEGFAIDSLAPNPLNKIAVIS